MLDSVLVCRVLIVKSRIHCELNVYTIVAVEIVPVAYQHIHWMRLSWQYAIIHLFFVPFTFSFCFNSIAIIGDFRLFSIDIRLFVLPRFRKYLINIKWLKAQYTKCWNLQWADIAYWKSVEWRTNFLKQVFFSFPYFFVSCSFSIEYHVFFHFKRFVLLHSTIYYLSRPFTCFYFYLSFFVKMNKKTKTKTISHRINMK